MANAKGARNQNQLVGGGKERKIRLRKKRVIVFICAQTLTSFILFYFVLSLLSNKIEKREASPRKPKAGTTPSCKEFTALILLGASGEEHFWLEIVQLVLVFLSLVQNQASFHRASFISMYYTRKQTRESAIFATQTFSFSSVFF